MGRTIPFFLRLVALAARPAKAVARPDYHAAFAMLGADGYGGYALAAVRAKAEPVFKHFAARSAITVFAHGRCRIFFGAFYLFQRRIFSFACRPFEISIADVHVASEGTVSNVYSLSEDVKRGGSSVPRA